MKQIFIPLSLILSLQLIAQDYQPKVKTDHLAIVVTDLNASATFYAEVLGLQEIINQTKKANIRWYAFADGIELHLIQVSKEGIQTKKDLHLAVAVNNLSAFRTLLESKNIPYENWQGAPNQTNARPDGINQVYLQDPDGYWIEVNDADRF